LIRYGFRELDRLNGYASGMPAPAYYQRLWQAAAKASSHKAICRDVAADVLTAFTSHLSTQGRVPAPPLPAVANALEQAVRLADLRGHAGPSRQDLLDACASAFLKDENTGGAAPILDELTRFLTGDRIGDIPPSVGSPPLVEAVREQARRLGFDLSFASRRKRELDIYRNDRHLQVSRFLHALAFLEAGFGTRLSGPDVLGANSRDILFETWQAAWSPMVEAKLIELSVHGDDLPTVAATMIGEKARELEELGQGRNALAGVRLLLTACLIGMQSRLGFIAALVGREIEADPDLASVVKAMSELFLLWRARAVLGLTGSPEVEALIASAYRRALYLLNDIVNASEERLPQLLGGLATLREVVASAQTGSTVEANGAESDAAANVIDPERFSETVARLVDVPMAPVLSGALAALAYLAGHRDAAFLVNRVRGGLNGAYLDPADKIAALNGVIAMTRELLWRVPGLLDEIDETIAGLDDARFLDCLPHLRLGFAALNPRETDEIAARIAGRRGVGSHALSTDVSYDISEGEVQANLALNVALLEQLNADGLGRWIDAEGKP
jgi:Family of unknown function (DUF5682)